jgi:hypothetical protein
MSRLGKGSQRVMVMPVFIDYYNVDRLDVYTTRGYVILYYVRSNVTLRTSTSPFSLSVNCISLEAVKPWP